MSELSTDSATITSRAVPRMPLARRSEKRIPRICHHDVTTDHDGLAVRNLVGQVAREKLGKGRRTLGDAFDDPKLRGSGAERCEKGGQHPVRHFAGRVVEERGQAESVYISGSRFGKRWGRRVHVRLLKIAWVRRQTPRRKPTSREESARFSPHYS